MEDRVPTGIPGLDDLISGGLPRGRTILLSGTCGTGKTTFAAQFLYNGATKYNEPGILVTLEQNSAEIRNDLLLFGMDIKKLEDEGKITLIDTSLSKIGLKDFMSPAVLETGKGSFSLSPGEFRLENLIALIIETANKTGAKRVVIDSLPALDYLIKDADDIRRTLININYQLKQQKLTTLILTEGENEETISKHGVEEYIADGVIIMKINEALDARTLKIRKLRATKHTLKPTTFDLTNQGITIKTAKGL
jgi:KaiC/GvpD/RAD55 family RecA-like ATPase